MGVPRGGSATWLGMKEETGDRGGSEGDRAVACRLREEELRGRREEGSRDRSEYIFLSCAATFVQV
jgi:hypothetical protein